MDVKYEEAKTERKSTTVTILGTLTLLVFIYYLFMNVSAFFCAFLFYARFRQEKVYLAIFTLSTIRTLTKECNWLVTFLCILSVHIS